MPSENSEHGGRKTGSNNRVYTRTFYEIIEPFPSILRHPIPLFQIVSGALYYLLGIFVYLWVLLKKGLSFFSKIEFFSGKPSAMVHFFDLDTLAPVKDADVEEVLSTRVRYLTTKESMELGGKLEKEHGYPISENVKGSYRIKVREETVSGGDGQRMFVTLSVPDLAVNIKNSLNIEAHLRALFRKIFGK